MSVKNPERKTVLSVVIPAHNCGRQVERAIASLRNQGIPEHATEIIVVNNGSVDGTGEVLARVERRVPNVRVVTTDSSGVSAARNLGMDMANGRYIAFVDADDHLDPMTLGPAVGFLEEHDDEVDLVTYPMLITENGKTKPHVREQVLAHTGVYDLARVENAFALVTNINVVLRNGPDTPRFRENLHVHEDLCFMLELLLRKERVGFSKSGAYRYVRGPESATRSRMDPRYHFEETMEFWEDLFGRYQGEPPVYLQASYLNELNWKLKAGLLFPRHYEGERYEAATARIWSLLQRVRPRTIANAPRMDACFRDFFARRSGAATRCECGPGGIGTSVFADGVEVARQDAVELMLCKTVAVDGRLCVSGALRSPLFNYIGKPEFLVLVDGAARRVALAESPSGFRGTDVPVSRDWEFNVVVDMEESKAMGFALSAGQGDLPLRVITTDRCRFRVESGLLEFREGRRRAALRNTDSGALICFDDAEPASAGGGGRRSRGPSASLRARAIRLAAWAYPKKGQVWLYCDSVHGAEDGRAGDSGGPGSGGGHLRHAAARQFVHDFSLGDGVERYFIAADAPRADEVARLGVGGSRVVVAGTAKHKLLYTQADVVIASEVGGATLEPFTSTGLSNIADLVNYQLCCLSPMDSLLESLRSRGLTRGYVDVVASVGDAAAGDGPDDGASCVGVAVGRKLAPNEGTTVYN